MPKISVLLPVYNASPYVGEAVESILRQTFTDLELIVIDDGSDDGSLAVLEEKATNDGRIKLISRENRGLVDTLNEALREASGAWVARMDADDLSHPRRLELQMKAVEERGLSLVGSSFQYFGDTDKVVRYPAESQRIRHSFYVWGRTFCHPSVLASRRLLSDIGYESRYRHAEDMALWSRILHRTNAVVGNVPEVLYSYRAHESQISSRQVEAQIAMSEIILKEALEEIGCSFTEEEFRLHAWIRRRGVFHEAEQLKVYSAFLQRLYSTVAARVGHSDKIFEHWFRIYKKHVHLNFGCSINVGGFGIKAPRSWRYHVRDRFVRLLGSWRRP